MSPKATLQARTSQSRAADVGTKQDVASRRLVRMLTELRKHRPKVMVELHYANAWELLVATILSAQCTDRRVNDVTPALFERYPQPEDMAKAQPQQLEALIRPTGFYKSKARHLITCAQTLVDRFFGKVPSNLDDLTSLPGVGRKTANVVLGNAFKKPAVIVDTHVKRVALRLGLTRSQDPDRIENDLQRLLPVRNWTTGSQQLLLHGRYVCLARKPQCTHCPITHDCTWTGKGRA